MRKDFGAKTWMYPLPVLIIGTYDEDGNADAMNAAWGGIYDTNKVVLCLSADHKTTKNIKAKGAFTVSFADEAHVVSCDYVGIVSANKEPDKLKKAGFTVTKSSHVDAPVINELPMALECRLVKFNEDGNVIGEIVNVSADESVLDENGKVDPAKLRPIAFDPVNNGYLVLGERVGSAFSDGAEL
ncbi:MAG: flavin reductase family protein [Firmicutes bacterium]|nr:flavin reductase family protein [[Eubacterium] siraeum]MCM1488889.1 flavin reductase family protein [Bacillota bacterium]